MGTQIIWQHEYDRPDVDTIVLVHCPGATEPIWLGYWDDSDEIWRTCDGMTIDVSHWAPLPDGPGN